MPGMLSFEMAESAKALEDVATNFVAAAGLVRDGARWNRTNPAYHNLGSPLGAEILEAAAWADEVSGWVATFHRNADFEHAVTLEDRRSRSSVAWTVGIAASPSISKVDPAFGVLCAAMAIDAVRRRFVESGRDETEAAVSRWGAAVAAMLREESDVVLRGIEFPSPYDDAPLLRATDEYGDHVDHPLLARLSPAVPTALHVTARDRRVTFGRTFDPQETTAPVDALGVLRTVAEIKTRLAASESGA
jgi:hypothetical protein